MSTIESLETDSGVIQDPKKISQSFTKYFYQPPDHLQIDPQTTSSFLKLVNPL